MEILNMSRGSIHVAMDDRTIRLTGEMMPSDNPVHFYADVKSIRTWDDGEPVSDDDRARIISDLPRFAKERGLTIVLD